MATSMVWNDCNTVARLRSGRTVKSGGPNGKQ